VRQSFRLEAFRLLSERGYDGFSLSDLFGPGRPRGSFYFHFPGGKAQVVEEGIRDACSRMKFRIATTFGRAATLDEGGAAFLRSWAEEVALRDFGGRSVLGAAALAAQSAPELAGLAAEVLQILTSRIAKTVRRFDPQHPDAEGLARRFLAAFEGGLVVAQLMKSTAPILAAEKALRN